MDFIFGMILIFGILFSIFSVYNTITKLIEKSACEKIDRFYTEMHQQETKLHRKLNSREVEILSLKCGF